MLHVHSIYADSNKNLLLKYWKVLLSWNLKYIPYNKKKHAFLCLQKQQLYFSGESTVYIRYIRDIKKKGKRL